MMGEDVLVQTTKGRLHRAVLAVDGGLLTREGCNLDDADAATVLTAEEAARALEGAEPWQLCRNDFPDVGGPGPVSSPGSPDPDDG